MCAKGIQEGKGTAQSLNLGDGSKRADLQNNAISTASGDKNSWNHSCLGGTWKAAPFSSDVLGIEEKKK